MEEYTSIGSIQAPYGCVFRREAKSVRMQILVRPYVKADICNDAREKNISVNELISRILEAYIENQKAKEESMINWNKKDGGRIADDEHKEVRIGIDESGKTANGEQRFSLALRFYEGAHKKITDGNYMITGLNKELHRIYFASASSVEGYKLSSPKGSKAKIVKFTIDNREDYEEAKGCYYLLKDVDEGLYYIDYSNK